MTAYAVHTTFFMEEDQFLSEQIKTRTEVSSVEVREVPEDRRVEHIRDLVAQNTANILNDRKWFFIEDSESKKALILRAGDVNRIEIEVFEIRELA